MSTIDNYLALDLGKGSAAAEDLLDRVDRESKQSELTLSGDGDAGHASANLTPAMSGWLGSNVLTLRQSAYASVRTKANAIKLPGGIGGVVPGIEDDDLKRGKAMKRNDAARSFYEGNSDKLNTYHTVETEYLQMRTLEDNREAKTPSRFLDFLLPVLIMIPEAFMNYSSFLKQWKIGVVALGITLVVAAAIGISGFVIGRFWKAYHYYMHPNDERLRTKGLISIGLALGLLVIALAVVGYARYRGALDIFNENLALGLPLPNVGIMTISLLAGNLTVFGIGVVATYLIHDENPDYAAKTAEYRRLDHDIQNLRRRQISDKHANIEREYDRDKDKKAKLWRQMEAQADFGPIGDLMGALEAKDSEAIALLHDYRNDLADRIGSTRPDFRFSNMSVERLSGQSATGGPSLAEFTASTIKLYRC